MNTDARIADRLREALAPTRLEVRNDSAAHAGHAGSPGTGDSHYAVLIVSERFEGMTHLQRQRQVYRILAEELAGPVHALALTTRTPGEASR